MQKVSACILAFNEAEKLKAAIETVLWADEIVVVDSYSVDATAQIAASLGARVVQVPSRLAATSGFSASTRTSAARRPCATKFSLFLPARRATMSIGCRAATT